MFPDPTDRLTAIRLCYNSTATTDPDSQAHMDCYYDFSITKNTLFAENTKLVNIEVLDAKKITGE
jgi:hypothetical protein